MVNRQWLIISVKIQRKKKQAQIYRIGFIEKTEYEFDSEIWIEFV